MSTLLGLDSAADPREWRRLTGFLGLGGRQRQRHSGNNDDYREGEEGPRAAAPNPNANVNGGERTPPKRKTRLSLELHPNAFDNNM